MKHVVSFSGGRTSAYLVYLMEQKRKKEDLDVTYVFVDTGAEHPKTYEFIRNVVEHWGIDLKCIRAVINPQIGIGPKWEYVPVSEIGWDLTVWRNMIYKHSTPFTPGGGFCTERLKTEAIRKFTKENFGKDVTTWIGIRADEINRLKEKPNVRYLAELSNFDRYDVIDWWKQQPFDLELKEWLGNCVFCIKKSVPKVALAVKDAPELVDEWIELTEDPKVRSLDRKFPPPMMYRGHNTLRSIRELYKDVPRDKIEKSLKYRKKFNTGSCSESCEAFAGDDDK